MSVFVIAFVPGPDDRSPQARDLWLAAQAAAQSSLTVVRLPFPFPEPDAVLPERLPGDLGVYSGPIPPSPDHYRALEAAVCGRGGRLVNTADASEQASRIEHWHSVLGELTAATVIVRATADVEAATTLGFPLFVKGLVKSAKEHGLAACLVRDETELRARADAAFQRGQCIVVRELLDLRRTGRELMRFPQSREYRVLLLDGVPLGSRFYWDPADPLGELDRAEHDDMIDLARHAASRLNARLVAVDVGQLHDRSWRVIEVGDSQHTALAHVPPHRYWTELTDRLS